MSDKKQKEMPSKELKVKIGKNSYTIKFPNNGQLIDIEVRKASITQGYHKELVMGLPAAVNAAMIVEAVCAFEVLLPAMKHDLNVASILELDMLQSRDIAKEYARYYEWMAQWRRYLNSDEEAEKEEEAAD